MISEIWMPSNILYNKANIERVVKNVAILSVCSSNHIFIHSAYS